MSKGRETKKTAYCEYVCMNVCKVEQVSDAGTENEKQNMRLCSRGQNKESLVGHAGF